MPNFQEILDKPVGETERPPLMPIGTYTWQIARVPEIATVGQDDRYDVVNFWCKCVGATDDVDEDELEKFGDITNVTKRYSFLFDREDSNRAAQSEFNLKRFLAEHLQIEGVDKMGYREALNNAVNHQFLGVIRWKARKDDPEVYEDEIGRTAPV